jgi:hypothetical protein
MSNRNNADASEQRVHIKGLPRRSRVAASCDVLGADVAEGAAVRDCFSASVQEKNRVLVPQKET